MCGHPHDNALRHPRDGDSFGSLPSLWKSRRVDPTALTLTITSLVVSLLALVTSGAAAWWTRRQATRTYTVTPQFGFMGRGLIVHVERRPSLQQRDRYLSDGYTRPLVGMTVRNTGAIPVVVDKWEISMGGASVSAVAEMIGPDLPHSIPAGASQAWWMPAEMFAQAEAAIRATAPKLYEAPRVLVTFGDGRTTRSKPLGA